MCFDERLYRENQKWWGGIECNFSAFFFSFPFHRILLLYLVYLRTLNLFISKAEYIFSSLSSPGVHDQCWRGMFVVWGAHVYEWFSRHWTGRRGERERDHLACTPTPCIIHSVCTGYGLVPEHWRSFSRLHDSQSCGTNFRHERTRNHGVSFALFPFYWFVLI